MGHVRERAVCDRGDAVVPTPRYSTPVSTMPGRFAGRGPTDSAGADTTTEETVEGVGPNGLYLVLGQEVPTRTSVQIDAGDRVLVRWHKAIPTLILEVRSRRGPGVDEPVSVGGDVEELFIAMNPDNSTPDVYFRNDQQITRLKIRDKLDSNPTYVKWATRPDAFVVGTATHHYYIFKIARNRSTPLGGTKVSATLMRDEQPLDAGIVLCSVTRQWAMTGEIHYFVFHWSGDVHDPTSMSEGASNTLSGGGTKTCDIILNRANAEVDPASPGAWKAQIVITDIQLDDALDLILSLQVLFQSICPDSAPPTDETVTHPVEVSDDGERNYPDRDGSYRNDVRLDTHAFVVNTTQKKVLFRTALAAVTASMTIDYHLFQQYDNGYGTVTSFPAYAQLGKNGEYIGPWLFAAPFPVDPAPELFFNVKVGGITSSIGGGQIVGTPTFEDVDTTVVPYLDLANRFMRTETPGATLLNQAQYYVFGFGVYGAYHVVSIHFTTVTIAQRKRFGLSATYLPRRATSFDTDGKPITMQKGLALVKVFSLEPANTDPLLASQWGLYLHDLETETITPISALTGNTLLPGDGAGFSASGFYRYAPPETDRVFVVLGFNGRHLLWLHKHSETLGGTPLKIEIKLTDVQSSETKIVFTSDAYAISSVDGAKILDTPTLSFLSRHFALLRPDFFYYPRESGVVKSEDLEANILSGPSAWAAADATLAARLLAVPNIFAFLSDPSDAAKAHQFLDAWTRSSSTSMSEPTLDATLPTFPPVIRGLATAGRLKKFTDQIVPYSDTILSGDLGPLNIEDWAKTGPSYQIIPDKRQLGSFLVSDTPSL